MQNINSDLSKYARMDTSSMDWESSPSGSVWRKPLYREGGESGPVTSIVRYDAGGKFPVHSHPQGEEILVLSGVFSDEHGDYPAGTYLLNPSGTQHAPHSDTGCTLLVRLRQYDGADRKHLKLDTTTQQWLPGLVPGLSVKPLYSQENYHESMALVKWEPGTYFNHHAHCGGEEILVLEGTFEDEHGQYPAGAWSRGPHMSKHKPFSTQGCVIYVRVGGLPAA